MPSFLRLDYSGIALLIMGSFVPWLYYSFYCSPQPRLIYLTIVCVLGIAAIIVAQWDRFSTPRHRPTRAGTHQLRIILYLSFDTDFKRYHYFSTRIISYFYINIKKCRFYPKSILLPGVFMGLGLSGIVPTMHFTIEEGFVKATTVGQMGWFYLMGAMYITGAGLYAARIPERYFPGKCDIWVSILTYLAQLHSHVVMQSLGCESET